MPSLIYITQIQSPSAELTQALKSSGVHVKSFGPGEITADECVLVMTPEAVLAGLRRPGLQSFGTPPLDAIQKHLGADAAIWNRISAGEVTESAAAETKAAAEQQASVAATALRSNNLGFVASQAGVRALAASQLSPATEKKTSGRDPGGQASRPSGRAATPGLQSVRSLWHPAALVALLALFAVMLLADGPAIVPASDIASVDSRNPGARSVSTAGDVDHQASTATSPTRPSKPASEARPHISDYDFVAEDYTNHFDQHSHPAATTQAPDLRRGAPNPPVRKRVVIN